MAFVKESAPYLNLFRQALIQHFAYLEVLIDRFGNFSRRQPLCQGFDHQSIQSGMLRLLHPMVFQKALELRIEILIVPNTLGVVRLDHPFDVQDGQRNREGLMGEHRIGYRRGRSDHFTLGAKSLHEVFAKPLEQVDVFRLFGGKAEQCARPGMIEDERQDELLDQAEQVQITVSPNLVECSFFS